MLRYLPVAPTVQCRSE
ncbi:MAG TPA: hypothetical protein ENN20_11030 [Candidatus Marinimicrobia bacterium]|nr:hypothetical protein [Candidatus Neomarinimicrobiota bacterium]